jgi:hypothetical protein
MTAFSTKKPVSNGVKKSIKKAHSSFDMRPLPVQGRVNIDNISDKEFEHIQTIAEMSFKRALKWKSQGFISTLAALISKTDITHMYKTRGNGIDIVLTKYQNGKISIKITQTLNKTVLVDTFIPYKTRMVWGKREGTKRASLLQNLFNAVRYQVDGITMAG